MLTPFFPLTGIAPVAIYHHPPVEYKRSLALQRTKAMTAISSLSIYKARVKARTIQWNVYRK